MLARLSEQDLKPSDKYQNEAYTFDQWIRSTDRSNFYNDDLEFSYLQYSDPIAFDQSNTFYKRSFDGVIYINNKYRILVECKSGYWSIPDLALQYEYKVWQSNGKKNEDNCSLVPPNDGYKAYFGCIQVLHNMLDMNKKFAGEIRYSLVYNGFNLIAVISPFATIDPSKYKKYPIYKLSQYLKMMEGKSKYLKDYIRPGSKKVFDLDIKKKYIVERMSKIQQPNGILGLSRDQSQDALMLTNDPESRLDLIKPHFSPESIKRLMDADTYIVVMNLSDNLCADEMAMEKSNLLDLYNAISISPYKMKKWGRW